MRPTVFLWGLPGQYINYERALEIAGGRPLASPDLRDAVRCAALLLPGGGDMEPRRYGQANTASRGLEPERDAGELFLLEQFIMEKKPVLGICRGLQVLNVFFGGTLIQDLPGHSQAAGRDRLHRVRTAPSPLQDLFGETLVVNSAHHQAADRLGQGLEEFKRQMNERVAGLAFMMAEKILRKKVEYDEAELADMVAGAVLSERDKENITVHIPEDAVGLVGP